MIQIQENYPLEGLNTFGIKASAAYFTEVTNEVQLQEVLHHSAFRTNKHLILGGGSNILFTGDFNGLVVKSSIKGISVLEETENYVLVQAGAGERWHDLVLHCLDRDWGGIENLSLIPGTTGAAPLQNIGAYGVEIKDVIDHVTAMDISTSTLRRFSNADCQFGYRESIFKQQLKEKYFISSITLRLTKRKHVLHLQYGAIQDVLKQQNIEHPSLRDVSNAVIAIRKSKLPDPRVIGNAGSFFKNPTLSKIEVDKLKLAYPEIPVYPVDNQSIKIAAGWLIEQCGWKGKRLGVVGVHPQQALVLVNYGNGKGDEIFQLAKQIQASVQKKFGIVLSTEVNVI